MTAGAAERDGSILIIDDEPANVRMLEWLLEREGYTRIVTTTESSRAIELFRAHPPDLVLLDLRMPPPDGYAVLDLLTAELAPGEILPIVVLTADVDADARQRALAAGAADFVTKPFETYEIMLRIGNLLRTRQLYLEIQRRNRYLEDRVLERTAELAGAQAEMLVRLAQAVEARDGETGEHTRRVGENSGLLAAEMGLSVEWVELIRRAAPLHDVGKIGIPDTILLKPAPLTDEEVQVVNTHTTVGADILARSESPLVRMAEQIARAHHERWDGSGYPQGLAGLDIPLEGRIVAVVDVFDALTHDRPYREAWPAARAIESIRRETGRHFDPDIVEAFLRLEASGRLMP
ncbi:MAG: response regulator [Gemmatimonadetes bacterium]|nr:response regulator [Gemmatimonadota bacterium]